MLWLPNGRITEGEEMKQPTNIDDLRMDFRKGCIDWEENCNDGDYLRYEDLKQLAIRRCKELDNLWFIFKCNECGHTAKHEEFYYKLRTDENWKCPKCKHISFNDIEEVMHPWDVDLLKEEIMRIFNIKESDLK